MTENSIDDSPYITCHVLDTITGKPAAGIKVQLTVLVANEDRPKRLWAARTDQDGRVKAWECATPENGVQTKALMEGENKEVVWNLHFNTEEYFGKGNTFWPAVQLMFRTTSDQKHYHVPLLLGPWSYTTYRGS